MKSCTGMRVATANPDAGLRAVAAVGPRDHPCPRGAQSQSTGHHDHVPARWSTPRSSRPFVKCAPGTQAPAKGESRDQVPWDSHRHGRHRGFGSSTRARPFLVISRAGWLSTLADEATTVRSPPYSRQLTEAIACQQSQGRRMRSCRGRRGVYAARLTRTLGFGIGARGGPDV